jgi:AmmeMemoRadiSam system protein A
MKIQDKQTLLNLAHEAIQSKLEGKNLNVDSSKISDDLKRKCGAFVTLEINGQLRGCIGHIAPVQALFQDVIENACAAAFEDPRFLPLTKNELEKTDIEVSVLSKSKKMEYNSPFSLVQILEKNKPGVILKKGSYGATFLPQVWDDLPSAQDFLSHLCLKAGLDSDEWTRGVEIETYAVEKISSFKNGPQLKM